MLAFEDNLLRTIDQKVPFTIEWNGDDHAIKKLKKSEWTGDQINRTAAAISRLLASKPLTPKQAFSDKAVLAARNFLRLQKPREKQLSQQLLATRLGTTTAALAANPEFTTFAQEAFLYNYLAFYDDTLKLEGEKIAVRQDGKHQPWMPHADVKAAKPWLYGPDGVQSADFFGWKTLEVFKREDPKNWGCRYLYEFLTCRTQKGIKGIFSGPHAWGRLYTPSGEIYSFGLYRPEKRDKSETYSAPLRVKEGSLMSPDISEFWPCEIRGIQVEITEEDFQKIKKAVEEDKAGGLTFQNLGTNCVQYVKEKGKLAEIDLPTEETIYSLLFPRCLKKVCAKIPECIKRVVFAVAAVFTNVLQLLLGAGRVDKSVRSIHGNRVKPRFSHPLHCFSPAKSRVDHPITLFERTYEWAMKWRNQEKVRLQSVHQDASQVDYQLPPKAHWKHF